MAGCKAVFSILIFFLTAGLIRGDGKNSKVLLLNSYHKGYLWSDEITRGAEEAFEDRPVDLYVEYMDTKRKYDDSYLDLLASLYKAKYADTDFDLVLTSDNNAYDFYETRGEELFGAVPHVFCGYNYLQKEDIPAGALATGINEEADLKGNLDLILSLHKNTERIIIITDDTTTGRQIQKRAEKLRDRYSTEELTIDLVYDLNRVELISLVENLPENTVVLITFFFVDRDGVTYGAGEAASLIRQYSPAPLYGAWDFTFGSGIAGGYLIDGYSQGNRAGKMALQILEGVPVSAVPPEYDTEYRLKFDYRELKRFSIPLSSLPKEGEIFFRPTTFFSRNARIIRISLTVFILQLTLILILISQNRSKKIIQKQLLSQGILLKQIIDHIPGNIYWKDREMRFLGCNRAYSDFEGKKEEELIGKSGGDDGKNLEVMHREIPLIAEEETRVDRDGKTRWFLVNRVPVKDARGDCIGILGTEEDITESKANLLKIEQAERKIRTIIDAIPHYIFVKNRKGDYLMANEETNRLIRKEGEVNREKAGKDEMLREDDLYVLNTGRGLNDIQRLYSSPGEDDRWLQMTKIPCPPDLFDEPAVLGVAMDISALKNAEKELQDREEDLKTTLDSIGDGVISTDEKGRIVRMNPVAEELTGWTGTEAQGMSLFGVLPLFSSLPEKKEVDPVGQILREQKKIVFSTDLTTTDRNGKERPLSLSCTPIADEGHKLRGAVIVFRDMTEENQLKKQLSQMDKMDTLGQLAGGITHDFNNMLGGIMGASQLIRPFVSGKKTAEEYLDLIVETSRKAADLTKELLVFSRKREKASTPFDLEREINETVKLLKRTIDKKIAIKTDLTGMPSPVTGDPSLVQNALMNLGINASHAMPGGGGILIKTERTRLDETACTESLFPLKPGTYLRISFSDTGTGIPEDVKDRIFEPFFTTKEEGKGTGLGLSAVYRTVERHGGSIEVESRLGEGTEFLILLPLTESDAPLVPAPEKRVGGTGNILVVDDDMVMGITAREILLELGYAVTVKEDGIKGMEYYRKNYKEIDLVILDMVMPRMNGRECFFAMKEINPAVKAILTSGFTSEEDLDRLREAGLAGFCRKPYTIAQLSQALDEALHKE